MAFLLISWFILSVAFWITAMILPGFEIRGFGGAIIVAAIFGIINALLGWFFFGLLTIATLGIAYLLSFITRWFINAIFLSMTSALSKHLQIKSFSWSLLGSLSISIVAAIIDWAIRNTLA
jgi:putative membrane protein